MTKARTNEFTFTRRYSHLRDLDEGASGRAMLVFDDSLDKEFVLKKYLLKGTHSDKVIFKSMKREVEALYLLSHENIIRIYNHRLDEVSLSGEIITEYVDGLRIFDHLANNPDSINSVFEQCINGFKNIEKAKVLHRDISNRNILVRKDGVVKIIDFGFSKQVLTSADQDKSETLRWDPPFPQELLEGKYNHATDVFFLGSLFQKAILKHSIKGFEYQETLDHMFKVNPEDRASSFKGLFGNPRANMQNQPLTTGSGIDDVLVPSSAEREILDSLLGQLRDIQVFYDDRRIIGVRDTGTIERSIVELYKTLPLLRNDTLTSGVKAGDFIECFLDVEKTPYGGNGYSPGQH